jgi:hypothetical protein
VPALGQAKHLSKWAGMEGIIQVAVVGSKETDMTQTVQIMEREGFISIVQIIT